jgi:choline dehydrogenase
VVDLPVGQRLQDQPVFHGLYALKAEAGARSPAAGAFIRTASSQAHGEELDLLISAAHLNDPGLSPTGGAIVLAVSVVRPESRGRLRLRSADPADAPHISLNLLGTPRDRSRMLEGQHATSTVPMGGDDDESAVVARRGAVHGG